jgi:hypothetical protein
VLYAQRMIFVEQMKRAISPYLPTTWASDISVDWSRDQLFVMGRLPNASAELQPSRDPFLRYLSSVRSEFAEKAKPLDSPHLSFANAITDEALVEFVNQFGPVVGTKVVADKGAPAQSVGMPWTDRSGPDGKALITAFQDLSTLRLERRTFAAALALLAELGHDETAVNISAIQRHISEIADGVWSWPEQQDSERQWRTSHNLPPVAWQFDSNHRDFIWFLKTEVFRAEPQSQKGNWGAGPDYIGWALRTTAYRAGHLVLCALINAFETEVTYSKDRPVETLPLGALRFGVRPALYLILKYLYVGGFCAPVCGNDRCRRFFEIKRAGQRFCKAECSEQFRQREYWAQKGSVLRKRRAAKKKKGSITRRK